MAERIFGSDARSALFRRQSAIRAAAELYNVDGRAVAGVIWWEYERNPRGWISDFFQYPWVRMLGGHGSRAGIGWGSMHLHVAKSLATDQNEADLALCLTEMTCAIHLIAAYLNRAAVAYEEHASVVIRNRPEILAALYNLGGSGPKGEDEFTPDAKRLGARRAAAMTAGRAAPEPSVGSSPLGKWVDENLGDRSPLSPTRRSCAGTFPSLG